MKEINRIVLAIWVFSLLLTIWPWHDYANKVNYLYSTVCVVIVFAVCLVASKKKPTLGYSIFSLRKYRRVALTLSIFLAVFCGITTYQFGISFESLSGNREIFEAEYSWFNYIYIVTIPTVITLSLTKYSDRTEALISRFAWFICCILLLYSGNRQFSFFSILYVCFFYIGKSGNPQKLLNRFSLLSVLLVLAAVGYSVVRLDYLQESSNSAVSNYMSSLTGASCNGGDYCDSYIETIFQFLYAYLGLNHSGFSYAIEFYNNVENSYPITSITFAMLYRRIAFLFPNDLLNLLNEQFDTFVYLKTGENYSHFFSTMFGGFALECGWLGVLIFGGILIYLSRILSRTCSRLASSELDYLIYLLIPTGLAFGIMQTPTTEPFFFMILAQFMLLKWFNNFCKA